MTKENHLEANEPKPLRVLMVEDSEDDVLFVIRELKKGGYNPVYERVETAAAMKKALREKPWDIILCDYKMPKFSAPLAIALLKESNIDIPLIIISGTIGEETAVECMRLGAHDYFMKGKLSRLCPAIARELEEAEIRNKKKQAEEALQESERKYHNLYHYAQVGLFETSMEEAKIIACNQYYCDLAGFPDVESAIGMDIRQLYVNPDDREEVKKVLRTQGYTTNHLLQLKNRLTGNIFWVEFSARLNPSRNVIEGSLIDVTERRLMDEELHASEERFRLLSEASFEGIIVHDEGVLLNANDQYFKMFGYEPGEALGKEMFSVTIDSEALEFVKKQIATGSLGPYESIGLRKDGTRFPMEIRTRKMEYKGRIVRVGAIRDITERKQSEEELRASETRYRSILEDIDEGYFEGDLSGKLTLVNDAHARNLQYSKEDLIGMDFRQFCDEKTAQRMLELYIQVAQTGKPFKGFEAEFYAKDGTKRIVEFSGSLMWDQEGKVIGSRGISRDVTERKQMEEALLRGEGKYRTILANIEDGYYEADLAGNLTFFNDSLCRLYGYSKDELMGMNYRQYADKETAKKVFQAFNQVYSTGKTIKEFNWQATRKDGAKRYVEVSISLQKDSSDKPTGFRGIVRDVTERKQAEYQREAALEALRQSEEKYRTILENIEEGYFEIDLSGNFKFFNDSMCRCLGYSQKKLMGMNYRKYTDKDNAKKLFQFFNETYTTGITGRIFEYEIIRKDGTRRQLEGFASLQKDSSGNPIAFRGTIRDITERKRTERTLRENEERLRGITKNLPGIIYQFYAKDSGEYGMSYVSERLKEYLGITANIDEMFPLFVSHVHEEDRDRYLASIQTAVETCTPWNFEGRVFDITWDKMIWFQCLATPTRHEDQIVFDGILLDITESKQVQEELKRTLDSLERAVGTTIQVLVSALEARDPYTAGHQLRVADLACAIATEMGLAREIIEGIQMAGSIHDIGKLSIPAEILVKPTKLTNIEFSLIKEHSQNGYEMLKDVGSPWPLAQIVYQHHERMNGTGYPRKLKGDEIILEARIMAVADVVEAMASHRPYRPGLGIDVALEEIEKNKGTLYDNDVANVCLRLFREKGYSLALEKS